MSHASVPSVLSSDPVESADSMKTLSSDSKENGNKKVSPSESKSHTKEPTRSSNKDQCIIQRQTTSRSSSVDHAANKSIVGLPSRVIIHQSAQKFVEDINHKRKQDTEFIQDFKKALEMNIDRTMGCVEQHLFQLYNHQSQKIQILLQTLFETLDRVASIETELQHFRDMLGSLYQDTQQND